MMHIVLFVIVMAVVAGLSSRAVRRSPGLEDERRTAASAAPAWDVAVVRAVGVATIGTIAVAGADLLTGWFPGVPLPVSVAASVVALAGAVLTYRAMCANAFFSSHVRVQADRGHVVVADGPYRVVRHPGYAGTGLFNLMLPMVLGSWLAFVPAVLLVGLLVWRTAREDRFLAENLDGYVAYASRVRYRVLPGIW